MTFFTNSQKSLDENGNSLQAFNSTMASSQQQNALKIKREKPKQKKSDRNVKVIRSEEVVGHRNETNIDLLVQFIENDVNPKKMNGFSKMNKSNYKSDNISNNKQRYLEDKTKKKDRKNKDLQRNLFKSNSLEEVSCSVLEDLTNDNSSITMRGKPKKESNSSNDRRSWGEVSYIEETNFNGRNTNNQEVFEQMFDPSIGLPCELSNNYAELSEFHVVTKKKKTKKYHNHNIFSGDEKINLQRNGYYHNHKFQENNFTSNDLYMNHGAMAEQRRKSTSSMPPSDKSDSSDLDSVHSLPVESTSKKLSVRQISTSSGGTPLASYADITKMPNISNDPCNDICFNSDTQDKWSPQSKNMFPSLIESTATNDKSNHPKTMSLNNYNFPDLIESCHYYSEVQKKKENEECNKQDTTKFRSKLKLSQSKSVDMEDVYIQHKNVRNNEVTKPVSKAKDNQKYVKIKSNAEEHLKEPKSVNSKNNLKEKQNNTYSEPYLLLEHDSKKKNNINTINITSDLVSVCIQHDKLSEKKNVISGEHIDNKQQTLPPVIILDEDYSLDVHSDNDITFGFELNEKLLSGELSDTDSNNTIVYQETEINDHTIVHDNSKIENLSHETQNTLNSVGNILDEVVSKPVLKISSESNNKSYPTMEHAGHNDKSECDNNFKMKVQTNNSKCLNSIKFIPPTNAGGFENHDKIVSFIGIG